MRKAIGVAVGSIGDGDGSDSRSSQAQRTSVAARIVGARDPAVVPDHDRAGLPRERAVRRDLANLVPKRLEPCDGVLRNGRLQLQRVAAVRERAPEQEARPRQRLERVEAVVDQPCQEGSQGLRLAVRALRAIEQVRLVALERQARVEGEERALARPQRVRAAGVAAEGAAAVVPSTPVSPTATPLPQSK